MILLLTIFKDLFPLQTKFTLNLLYHITIYIDGKGMLLQNTCSYFIRNLRNVNGNAGVNFLMQVYDKKPV